MAEIQQIYLSGMREDTLHLLFRNIGIPDVAQVCDNGWLSE